MAVIIMRMSPVSPWNDVFRFELQRTEGGLPVTKTDNQPRISRPVITGPRRGDET